MGTDYLRQKFGNQLMMKTKPKIKFVKWLKLIVPDALFDLAISLVAKQNYSQVIDKLFIIFNVDAEYKDGAVK